MRLFNRKPEKRETPQEVIAQQEKKIAQLLELINSEGISCAGYHSLDQDPTIVAACKSIADLVGLVSWHLMQNQTDGGDLRI